MLNTAKMLELVNLTNTPPHATFGQQDQLGRTVAVMFNLYEAKTQLSELVDRAAAGEEIIIAKAGKPLAKLVAVPERTEPRQLGVWAGNVWISPDFDEPLPADIMRYFEGDDDDDDA